MVNESFMKNLASRNGAAAQREIETEMSEISHATERLPKKLNVYPDTQYEVPKTKEGSES